MGQTTARIKKIGKHFEILVDMDKALAFKKEEQGIAGDFLESGAIYADMKKGEKAPSEDLKSAFGTEEVNAIAEKIVKEGIHAHFYFCSDLSDKKGLKTEGTVKTEEEIKENFYEKYKKEPFIKYFHLEKSFDPKGIVKEISKYDFGFWPECEFDVKLATGNKFSTFIEAGIPFFYFQTHEFTDKQAKDYGLHVLRADNVKNFKKKIEELNYDKLIESLKEARKDYLMEKHLPRLEKFIKDVVQEKRNKK